ncbi:rRNA maturation RNase YbeY [soil metagenome]
MKVFVADEQSEEVDAAWLRALAIKVLEEERCPKDTELSVMLVGDEEMTRYNSQFMDRVGPTDVLSLLIEELRPGLPPRREETGPPLMLGDVILDPAHIRRQAGDQGVLFEDQLALLTVHGVLHLLGYDHADGVQADQMEERERQLLAAIGKERP